MDSIYYEGSGSEKASGPYTPTEGNENVVFSWILYIQCVGGGVLQHLPIIILMSHNTTSERIAGPTMGLTQMAELSAAL